MTLRVELMRRRIAVLAAQLEEKTQTKFLQAFMEEAYARDYDICVFAMTQKFQETEPRGIGDSNIFTLINFEMFDGVVILLDTLMNPGQGDKIQRQIKEEYKGPVIVVDHDSDYFESVMIDHRSPVAALVDHLIEKHGYKDIAFLGGKKNHPHSIQRLNGFRDSMERHGLEVRKDWLFDGNFWYDGGYRMADILMSRNRPMPEAIVCANDYMAMGVASELSERGYKIPEDVAVVGYDSTEEGKLSPRPLTSAEIPAGACGIECFRKLHTMITGEIIEDINLNYELYIGESCGCTECKQTMKNLNRTTWKVYKQTNMPSRDYNHITDDMLCQTDFDRFYSILSIYTYQIKPFHGFWMCLNDDFLNTSAFIGDNARRRGYSDNMKLVIARTEDNSDLESVDFNRSFATSSLLPELEKERDYPTTFVFLPMFFEDRSFGYVALNFGKSFNIYNRTLRIWLRDIAQGIEAFYRQKALVQLVDRIKADQIRDSLTGLYNYDGFYQRFKAMAENNLGSGKSIGVVLFDLSNLKNINTEYGRNSGDNAILALSRLISMATRDNEICGRLCNDEFLIGFVGEDCSSRYNEIVSEIPVDGIACHISEDRELLLYVYHAMKSVDLDTMPDLDYLINHAVNAKNHYKRKRQRNLSDLSEMTQEEVFKCHEVERILDNNLLNYHFQPIVSASNGEIYGYEALMRYEYNTSITPYDILRFAKSLGRLYEIEKATFTGVLNHLENSDRIFDNKKIFINSLPGHHLKGKDLARIKKRLNERIGQVVVEITEESEISDEEFNLIYETQNDGRMQLALDDYGSGYSNANNILRYRPGYIKVDRSLISDIDTNSQKRYFVQSLIEYAKNNNIKVLAEGVETKEELRTVIILGVDFIQGFYTGRPSREPLENLDEELMLQIKDFQRHKDSLGVL